MKRYHDWYSLQKNFQGWDEIRPDHDVLTKLQDRRWSMDLTHCHENLKRLLREVDVAGDQQDFFIITDLELSKFPLHMFFKIVEKKYQKSRYGGYIAALSYYLNPRRPDHDLSGTYSENIDRVFRSNLHFANKIECVSQVNDDPISIVVDNRLLEGTNFIFVHPNIRYYLWK